jgi:hypothetical protein
MSLKRYLACVFMFLSGTIFADTECGSPTNPCPVEQVVITAPGGGTGGPGGGGLPAVAVDIAGGLIGSADPCELLMAGLPGTVGDIGYVQSALLYEGSSKGSCTATADSCVSSCKSRLTYGLSDYSDELGFILSVGGTYTHQRLEAWTLGTAARLALVRACATRSAYAAAIAGSYFAGVSLGCRVACNHDACAW